VLPRPRWKIKEKRFRKKRMGKGVTFFSFTPCGKRKRKKQPLAVHTNKPRPVPGKKRVCGRMARKKKKKREGKRTRLLTTEKACTLSLSSQGKGSWGDGDKKEKKWGGYLASLFLEGKKKGERRNHLAFKAPGEGNRKGLYRKEKERKGTTGPAEVCKEKKKGREEEYRLLFGDSVGNQGQGVRGGEEKRRGGGGGEKGERFTL